jgi:hypothetical protein
VALACFAVAAALAACGGEPRGASSGGGAGAAATRPARDRAVAAESLAAERDEWNRAEVVKRLTEAGLVVADSGDTVRHAFLAVPGSVLRVGGHELQIFVYPDTLARSRDSRRLDSATASPRGERVSWSARPHLITSGNLLAILLTPRAQLAERVTLTLTARHLGIGR